MSDRFEEIKSQYRRWPGDTEPNGNWGGDIAWLIDEVVRLRQLPYSIIGLELEAENDRLRAEAERLRIQLNGSNAMLGSLVVLREELDAEVARLRKALQRVEMEGNK